MKYNYKSNKATKTFDVMEIETESVMFRAETIGQAKDKIKALETQGFQGFTPKFMIGVVGALVKTN